MYLLVLSIVIFVMHSVILPSDGHDDHFSREWTYRLKGVLAIIIVLHHLSQYCYIEGIAGVFLRQFCPWGIYVVGIFFFVSGYGLMTQYKLKRDEYVRHFLSKRFGKLFPAFILFLIIRKILNYFQVTNYSLWEELETFILTGNGFCMWFIPALFLFYLLFYFSIRYIKNSSISVWVFTVVTIIFSIILKLYGFGEWWYVSNLCMPIGVLYSFYEEKFKLVYDDKGTWILFGFACVLIPLLLVNGIGLTNLLMRTLLVSMLPILLVWCTYNIQLKQRSFYISDISYELLFAHGLCINQLRYFGFSDLWIVLLTIPIAVLISHFAHVIIIHWEK